ncbi:SDR family oxidoreductase [Brevundimonas sp.]|uniref:SDR family oxidoreductase n=1 Tax=Brevundimonas sp. TaxID=1871086 RepID=UPI0018427968|nr:SDR family oxidoreductase [Brevundimonas sp.]MBA4806444.1 SDR family oxidoreductase [Brevundimonas sp.]
MRVFLTGATGFIGSRITGELLSAGHEVLGLTRSASGAAALEAAGAVPHRGDVEDLDSLRAGAADSDAVIHTAFDHDFSRYAANCEKDRRAIAALGETLERGDRPLIITSVTGIGSSAPGEPAVEDHLDLAHPIPRVASEQAGEALKAEGVNVITVRLPQVHDTVRQGLISPFIDIARERGVSAYVGEGATRFSAAHVSDVALLYRLALEKGQRNARYHAVAEEGVTLRAIAEVLGAGLGLPVVSIPADRAGDHFGYMATFAGLDLVASSAWTRDRLGWTPEGPDLLSDLRAMDYASPAAA